VQLSPHPSFHIHVDQLQTELTNMSKVYVNDVIEFDGIVVCGGIFGYGLECGVIAQRVANLGDVYDAVQGD